MNAFPEVGDEVKVVDEPENGIVVVEYGISSTT